MQTQSLYTYRPLVYRRRDSMEEFFEESPLWEVLYRKLYLPLKKKWNIKIPTKDVFNEACALMKLAQTDSTHPEELDEFEMRILFFRYDLKNVEAADLCWTLVYALTLRANGTRRERLLHSRAKKELAHRFPDVNALLLYVKGLYNADQPQPTADAQLTKENKRLKEEIERLKRDNARLEDENETRGMNAKRLKTMKASLSEENARLKDENARLAARVAQLEQMLAERDTVQRLPLSDFLTHMEQHFTHEQNPSALIVKDVLFALYTNPTAEERCRLNKLGHVPPPPPFGGITVQGPLNDIHGNEHVKAGL